MLDRVDSQGFDPFPPITKVDLESSYKPIN
jgi:hypothetical protein